VTAGDWLPAALGLIIWAVVAVAVRLASEPRPVDPAPPRPDLPGDEPPAVVAMLVDDWQVGEGAIEATLLDLAARAPWSCARRAMTRSTRRSTRAAATPPT